MPITSKFRFYRNRSLQFCHRGKKKSVLFLLSPHLMQILLSLQVCFRFNYSPSRALFSFTFVISFSSSSLLSANRVVSSAYLRLLIFFPPIFTLISCSSRFACLIMYSLYIRGENTTLSDTFPNRKALRITVFCLYFCFLVCEQ